MRSSTKMHSYSRIDTNQPGLAWPGRSRINRGVDHKYQESNISFLAHAHIESDISVVFSIFSQPSVDKLQDGCSWLC
jgi:hypothetical protein